MASTWIKLVGDEAPKAREARNFIDQLQAVQNASRKLKAVADQAAMGGDWAGLRAAFGFSSDAEAEAAYNLLGSVNTTLTTDAFIAQMLSRLG